MSSGHIDTATKRKRIAEIPELAAMNASLSAYRQAFVETLESLRSFDSHNFDPPNPDPRAISRTSVFNHYVSMLETKGREPSLAEFTKSFNQENSSAYSSWTLRRCIREINRKKPQDMPPLILGVDFSLQLHLRTAANACLNIIKRTGAAPTRIQLMKELRTIAPEANVSFSQIPHMMKKLRAAGLSVNLRVGKLTRGLIEKAYLEVKSANKETPGIREIKAHLLDKYGIRTRTKNIVKMLQLIRRSKPPEERGNWTSVRNKKAFKHELIDSYSRVKKLLSHRGIKRHPTALEVYQDQAERKGITAAPSLASVSAYLNQIKTCPLCRLSNNKHDLIEETAFILRSRNGSPASLNEILLSLKKAGIILSESYAMQAIERINNRRSKEGYPLISLGDSRSKIEKRNLLAKSIVTEGLHARFGTKIPSYLKPMQDFLVECVYVTLQQEDDKPSKGKHELKLILDLHARLQSMPEEKSA